MACKGSGVRVSLAPRKQQNKAKVKKALVASPVLPTSHPAFFPFSRHLSLVTSSNYLFPITYYLTLRVTIHHSRLTNHDSRSLSLDPLLLTCYPLPTTHSYNPTFFFPHIQPSSFLPIHDSRFTNLPPTCCFRLSNGRNIFRPYILAPTKN